MADIVDKSTRSRMMSAIRGRNTKPEMQVRQALHALGLRYRLHSKGLPGRPDLVFPAHRVAVFVHGCFWHGHRNCPYFKLPGTRQEFWKEKLDANRARDLKNLRLLRTQGWKTAVVWECALRQQDPALFVGLAEYIKDPCGEQSKVWSAAEGGEHGGNNR